MNLQRRDFLLVMTLVVAAMTPASAQTVAPTVGRPAHGGTQGTESVPDFSGIWLHPSLPGFEPLSSGPTSLVNRSRRRAVLHLSYSYAAPCGPALLVTQGHLRTIRFCQRHVQA
jgi:hypothetical protein